MSSETLPISNPRFAAALKDLSLASLHLKTLEIRNSLAHLAYSNAQLRPFAEGALPTLDMAASSTENNGTFNPDPDCVEAIRENEVVMQRMRERIELVRAEVEGRGVSWREFESPEDTTIEDTEPGVTAIPENEATREGGSLPLTNGVNGHDADAAAAASSSRQRDSEPTTRPSGGSNPWTDGTFQTGVIRNGEVHMDAVPGSSLGRGGGGGSAETSTTTTAAAAPTSTTGGRLTDEQLRRLLEQRLAEDNDECAADEEEDGGLHL